MTDKKTFTDIFYQVGELGESPITVSPDPDNPSNFVRIHAMDSKAKEYWGNINFSLSNALARRLGEALIAAAGVE